MTVWRKWYKGLNAILTPCAKINETLVEKRETVEFTRAFRYPFHNSAKVTSIVLVMTIIFTFFVILIANSFDWAPHLQTFGYGDAAEVADMSEEPGAGVFVGLMGLLAFLVFGGFWINGYSVDVVRTVMNGIDTMPEVEIGANIRKGFWIFLSGLWYGVAALVVMGVLALIGSLISNMGGLIVRLGRASGDHRRFCLCLPVGLGISYWHSDLCRAGEAGSAFCHLQQHWYRPGKPWHLIQALGYNVLLYFVYSVVRGILERLFGAVVGPDLVVAATLGFIIYFAANLFLHFSTQHLIAQYGLALELYEREMPGKEKLDYE